MNKKSEETTETISEAVRHADRATALLKESVAVHEAEKQGLIDHDEAIQQVIALNNEAIAESEKAIELNKELLENS